MIFGSDTITFAVQIIKYPALQFFLIYIKQGDIKRRRKIFMSQGRMQICERRVHVVRKANKFAYNTARRKFNKSLK